MGIMAGLIFVACLGKLYADDAESSGQKVRNGGYYLLYHLLDEESDVDKIMLIKNAPPEIGHFTKTVSSLANSSLASLDDLKSRDATIRFDQNPLPAVEVEVRHSIADDKQHKLLFGTKGPAFVRALIVSQIEAAGYAEHLAGTIAQHESGDHARDTLEKISEKWARVADQAYSLLGSPAAQ